MAPMGVACQAMPRWLTTPLAASPASFQPSNPAIATGDASSPMLLNSMLVTSPAPDPGPVSDSLRAQPCSPGYRAACQPSATESSQQPLTMTCLRLGADEHATNRLG